MKLNSLNVDKPNPSLAYGLMQAQAFTSNGEWYSNFPPVKFLFILLYIGFAGFSNLTSLSFKRSDGVTAKGMSVFANLVNLVNLDLERCLKIHGGLVHVKGITLLNITLIYLLI